MHTWLLGKKPTAHEVSSATGYCRWGERIKAALPHRVSLKTFIFTTMRDSCCCCCCTWGRMFCIFFFFFGSFFFFLFVDRVCLYDVRKEPCHPVGRGVIRAARRRVHKRFYRSSSPRAAACTREIVSPWDTKMEGKYLQVGKSYPRSSSDFPFFLFFQTRWTSSIELTCVFLNHVYRKTTNFMMNLESQYTNMIEE